MKASKEQNREYYLKTRKSKKQYNAYEDYGAEIKSQKDGYYTLARMIFENANKDKECFIKGIPPAGAQGAHKLKDGSYQYPGIQKQDPVKEWNDSLILALIKDAI